MSVYVGIQENVCVHVQVQLSALCKCCVVYLLAKNWNIPSHMEEEGSYDLRRKCNLQIHIQVHQHPHAHMVYPQEAPET